MMSEITHPVYSCLRFHPAFKTWHELRFILAVPVWKYFTTVLHTIPVSCVRRWHPSITIMTRKVLAHRGMSQQTNVAYAPHDPLSQLAPFKTPQYLPPWFKVDLTETWVHYLMDRVHLIIQLSWETFQLWPYGERTISIRL